MATGAILFWPEPVPAFDPEKAFGFIAAVAVWLFAEFFPEGKEAPAAGNRLSVHDTEFASCFGGVASDEFLRFLDEHDFGGSFHERDTKPLYAIEDMLRNASSEFDDSALQEQLDIVGSEVGALSKALAYGAAPKNARASLFTMIPEDEPDGLWSDATVKKVQAANSQADEVSTAIKALFRLLREKGFTFIGAHVTRN